MPYHNNHFKNNDIKSTHYTSSHLSNMCEFCDPQPRTGPIDMTMGDNRSFQFFSMAAIDEAIRQTSGGSTPVCDQHRAMFCIPIKQEESEESEHDNEEEDGEGDDEHDGT